MSKQNSLDKYFTKQNENFENTTSIKKPRIENENNIIQLDIVASFIDHASFDTSSIPIDTSNNDIQSIDENCFSITKTTTATATDVTTQRSYKTWYSTKFPWLVYEPNIGGFCTACRNYWKSGTPSFHEMEQKTKGVFVSVPFTNWKNAPGNSGRLTRHTLSEFHRIAIENDRFRTQEGSVANQLLCVSESQKRENRDRLGDLLDCSYFLFKNELPHTTLYNSLLQLVAHVDHSGKLVDFFTNCKKNASYDSTTAITELLAATNEVIEKNNLDQIRKARVISIMSDEGTDINRHGNLCICIRYCNQLTGEPVEAFVTLLQLKNKDAESIFNTLVTELGKRNIDLNKTRFAAFDGAAVFSGIHNGVAARIRVAFSSSLLFIHCRAHVLQLAVVSAADGLPEISRSLSALKSLINFINRSSVRLTLFEDIQGIIQNQHIKLIRPGDTRWLSNSGAIRSIIRSYQALLITLEHMSNEYDEDSAEALGLYHILSSRSNMFILHTLEPIFDTLAILSKSIQTKAADFKQLQNYTSSTLLRLEELKDYSTSDYTNIIKKIESLSVTQSLSRESRSSASNVPINYRQVFEEKILPFIEKVIDNIRARFQEDTLNLLDCFSIFEMENVNGRDDYGEEELASILTHYSHDFDESITYEWKTFRKYLLKRKQNGQVITQRQLCINLVQDGTLKEVYPQLSLAAEIFLCAPISTATVERQFSTTNRILTDLRNRLTTDHVDQLMRISIEGPDVLNLQIKEEIINCWKLKKQRRLAV